MDLWEPGFMTMDRRKYATRIEKIYDCLKIFPEMDDITSSMHHLNSYLEQSLFSENILFGNLTLKDLVKLNEAYKDLANVAFDVENISYEL